MEYIKSRLSRYFIPTLWFYESSDGSDVLTDLAARVKRF